LGTTATFRDPGGSVFFAGDRIFRLVSAGAASDLRHFLDCGAAQEFIAAGKIVRTAVLDGEQRSAAAGHAAVRPVIGGLKPDLICEHERIGFPSYPYEWCPEMLHAAGRLTIELGRSLLTHGIGLKDATPFNVLFRGPHPIFVDVLSFETRAPGDCMWLPYAQFMRTFVLPLVANRYFGVSLSDIFLSRRDGLEPAEVYRWTKLHQRIRPPFLSTVSLPTWLSNGKQINENLYKPKQIADAEKARFVLESLLSRSDRLLRRLEPPSGVASVWSDYVTSNNNYSAQASEAKKKFVATWLERLRPKKVLDVGCNTGEFSRLAAESGSDVVAIDYDPVVVGNLWRRSKAAGLSILPLVVNLSRPSPATGWRNDECKSFLARAEGAFDLVLMLAVIHHMLVTDRIPLGQIFEVAAGLTQDWAIIEYVGTEDSMFRKLTRGRDHLHAELSEETFVAQSSPFFEVVQREALPEAHRSLYLLRKRAS
jgi:SAM-dependent methyltransferase